MTQYLPPNLLALFAPRDPVPFLPPPDKLPHEKKNRGYNGVGDFLQDFEDPKETPPPTRVETRDERLERRRRERAEQVAYKLEQEIAMWDPHSLTTATVDPFRTLFVARINYDTSESKLRREFEVYGPIKKIVLTHNLNDGKPRGYAFIEYEHERDMHTAYKHADGKKIDGRRVLVDVERGRTVKGWLPRRLGGGLGGTRRGGPDVNIKHSGREDNERERERYRLERERESRGLERERGAPPDRVDRADRRRSRSRERGERRKRSRSRSPRERKRHRSRSRERDRAGRAAKEGAGAGADLEEVEERPPREPREARDRGDRERERGERDRKRSRRSRSRERGDRKKDKRDRGDRDSRKERRDRSGYDRGGEEDEPRIKQEPMDDYPDYLDPTPNYSDTANFGNANIKFERQQAAQLLQQAQNDDMNGSRRASVTASAAAANNSFDEEDEDQEF